MKPREMKKKMIKIKSSNQNQKKRILIITLPDEAERIKKKKK